MPNEWRLGTVVGVRVDSRDHVWIVHRPGTLRPEERGAADVFLAGSRLDGFRSNISGSKPPQLIGPDVVVIEPGFETRDVPRQDITFDRVARAAGW